jgi:uncharacterized protein (TIGR03435 family)
MQAGFAQTVAGQKFAVASVKAHDGQNSWFKISGSRVSIHGFMPVSLISYAYGLGTARDVADFAKLDRTQYDIEADVGDGVVRTRKEFQPLLQALLAERFHLLAHKETKQTPVYALVVDKNGLKCKPSEGGTEDPSWETKPGRRSTKVTFARASMDSFTRYLNGSSMLDRRVLNETGIIGTYAIEMTYVAQSLMDRTGPVDPDEMDVFAALREQLGLRLERKTVPQEFLVVDRWEKPSEN